MPKFVAEMKMLYRFEYEAENIKQAEELVWHQPKAGFDLLLDSVEEPIISIMTKEEFDRIKPSNE